MIINADLGAQGHNSRIYSADRATSAWTRWLIVLSCFSGLIVSSAAINTFAFSVLLKPLAANLSLSRGDISLGLAMGATLTGVASLFIGYLMDRFGMRKIMLPGIFLFALATAAFGLVPRDNAWVIYLVFIFGGVVTAAQQPVGYVKMISLWFDDRRGLMLGIALSGVGIGALITPQLAGFFNRTYGMQSAFFALAAAIILLALIPVALTFSEPPRPPAASTDHLGNGAADIGLRKAAKDSVFWRINFGLLLAVCAINGTLTHIVAMLTDRGVPPQQAINVLSAAGIFIAVGRIAAGWCLDRFRGQTVAVIFITAPMIGIALLIGGAGGFVPILGGMLCGLGVGAEVDLAAYFLGRYFGVRAIASLFGVSAATLALASAAGPYIMGRIHDGVGTYLPALIAFEGLLALAMLMLCSLGPYRFKSKH
jgi:MFS family permease